MVTKYISDPEYYATAHELVQYLAPLSSDLSVNRVIAIGGESGCGKSVLGQCLKDSLLSCGVHAIVIQLDDYFHLPPADNHAARLRNLKNVGMHEVNMALLQQHIDDFKKGEKSIEKPISSHTNNEISVKTLRFGQATTLIVEGTYALFLDRLDTKIYMARTYKETLAQRISRGRDVIDEFSNAVLEIEHQIVAKSEAVADFIVRKDYSVAKRT